MNVTEFLDYMKADFSPERIETNENNFLEYFFYYKRNIRDFLAAFRTYNGVAQQQIITFLLHMYPLSDNFLPEILKELKIELHDEIMIDTINYISSAFVEELGELNIDFDEEIKKYFQKILEIRDIIDFNQIKMTKLLSTRKEFSQLKEKDEQLSREIKELENGNISALKDEIAVKQRRFDELKTEKAELNKQFEKLRTDLNELNRYGELREQVARCREILRETGLPKDYTDKKLVSDV